MNQVINVQPIDEWYMYIVLFLYLLKGVWFGHATSKAFLSSSMSNYLLALEFLIGHHTHLEYIHVHAFFYKKDALLWQKFAIAICTYTQYSSRIDKKTPKKQPPAFSRAPINEPWEWLESVSPYFCWWYQPVASTIFQVPCVHSVPNVCANH